MIQIETTKTESELRVASPYNPEVIASFRSRGGKWDAAAGEWVFKGGALRNGEIVVDELFGSSAETVTVRVVAEEDGREYMSNADAEARGLPQPRLDMADRPDACGYVEIPGKARSGFTGRQYLVLGGYLLASRRSRDARVFLTETLVSGTLPDSGGSAKNPAVSESDDAAFELEVRQDFAARLGLVAPPAEESPLAVYSDAELREELARREEVAAEDDFFPAPAEQNMPTQKTPLQTAP